MLINIKFIHNVGGGVTTRIFFPQGHIEFDTFFLTASCKPLIKKMVQEGVILKDGNIDTEKAIAFANKYEGQ